MWKAALAGALALATIGSPLASLPAAADESGQDVRVAAASFAVTEGHIARLKATLNLTPAQERHWGPVEAALRTMARIDSSGVRRLLAAASPLIRSLDADQKRQAVMLARALGIGNLAAAL